eukprot:2231015-Pyramimonas_sp.AAC.1
MPGVLAAPGGGSDTGADGGQGARRKKGRIEDGAKAESQHMTAPVPDKQKKLFAFMLKHISWLSQQCRDMSGVIFGTVLVPMTVAFIATMSEQTVAYATEANAQGKE